VNLPDRLARRAVVQLFDRLTEARWGHLFEHEARNGIAECRVVGPFKKAYYSTVLLQGWLITEGYYLPADFRARKSIHPGLTVRTHVLV